VGERKTGVLGTSISSLQEGACGAVKGGTKWIRIMALSRGSGWLGLKRARGTLRHTKNLGVGLSGVLGKKRKRLKKQC